MRELETQWNHACRNFTFKFKELWDSFDRYPIKFNSL